ncbi:glyoxalase family protein [Aeropyrum pernix]|uniref:Glyoxalase family protein n=1 Tax=Aeropyrum pernix TaxID=56636 RepID=A0A401HC15_AERPX|nr:VOC family protein [Aeropyrum pernix]GBF09981.1 glyoxalase family protein [Aeropyrum pernix]
MRHGFVIRKAVLIVRRLEEAERFYTAILNRPPEPVQGGLLYRLEGGSELLLRQNPRARPPIPGAAGLYHIAFTVDKPGALPVVVEKLRSLGSPLLGASDHCFTLAVYTLDPEGNGVEVYWDKDEPCERLVTKPLDPRALTVGGPSWGYRTSIGHIHLKVARLEDAEVFYTKILGMSVTERGYPGALFFAYGDYHHHVAANTWETRWGARGSRPQGPVVGLESYTLRPPNGETDPGIYEDPAGVQVIIV